MKKLPRDLEALDLGKKGSLKNYRFKAKFDLNSLDIPSSI